MTYGLIITGFGVTLQFGVKLQCYSILCWTAVTHQCGTMFLLCNYQLSDMFRPYRAIIRLYKIMVLDKVHAVVHTL